MVLPFHVPLINEIPKSHNQYILLIYCVEYGARCDSL